MRGRITQNQSAPNPIKIRANATSLLQTFDFRGGGEGGEGFNSFGWVIWVLILLSEWNRGPRLAFLDSRILAEV